MATNGANNIPTGVSGTILQGQGLGTNCAFSTATYPSTAGASGNVLTSNGTNWTSAAPAGGPSSANSTISWFDDLFCSLTPTNISNSTATCGAWALAASGSGTFIYPGFGAEVNHPGTFYMQTGTTANNFCAAGISNYGPFLIGGGIITSTFYFKLPTLSSVSSRYLVTVGLGDASSTGGTGAYVQYTDNVNTGKWTYTCSNSGTATTTNSSTSVSSGWQVIQIVVNAAGSSISFSAGSTLSGLASLGTAISTNMPTAQDIGPYFRINFISGTQGILIADLVTITQPLTTPR